MALSLFHNPGVHVNVIKLGVGHMRLFTSGESVIENRLPNPRGRVGTSAGHPMTPPDKSLPLAVPFSSTVKERKSQHLAGLAGGRTKGTNR